MAEDGQLTRAQMTRLAKKDAVMKMTKSIQCFFKDVKLGFASDCINFCVNF